MDWFKNWFDSFYYHKLYRHRNTEEAALFIDNLVEFLPLSSGDSILDLACGKGRHSIYLNKKGFDVIGVDLSLNSIISANKFSNPQLHFYQMDMREIELPKKMNVVMNLFTSFGYFNQLSDNLDVLKGVHNSLKPKGCFVIDFLNATRVIKNLVPEETQIVDDIEFTINREVKNNTIVKSIQVKDSKGEYGFEERVSTFELNDFKAMFEKTGFTLIHHFGDYQLNEFNELQSDRLILIAQKND